MHYGFMVIDASFVVEGRCRFTSFALMHTTPMAAISRLCVSPIQETDCIVSYDVSNKLGV